MRREVRNVVVLSTAQAVYGLGFFVVITLAGLAGQGLAPDPGLATLPVSAMILGTALSTVPASLLMQRFGRRAGFMGGAFAAMAGSALSCLALVKGSFWLFVAGGLVYGIFNATAQYYRFAAADAASAVFRPRAISLVIAGGVVAALLGPLLVGASRDLFLPLHFLGGYVALFGVSVLALLVAAFVDIPVPERNESRAATRPVGALVRQPAFLVAVLAGIVAQSSMNLIMTATPIAMVACAHSVDMAAGVIGWHALAMYVPAFFTGSLISRFGIYPVLLAGLALLAGCALVALTGTDLANFGIALVLLGLGWSLAFVGATSLLAETYGPAERGKAQGLNDFLVYLAVTASSFASGQILAIAGWKAVNWSALPLILLAAAAVVRLLWKQREGVRAGGV